MNEEPDSEGGGDTREAERKVAEMEDKTAGFLAEDECHREI